MQLFLGRAECPVIVDAASCRVASVSVHGFTNFITEFVRRRSFMARWLEGLPPCRGASNPLLSRGNPIAKRQDGASTIGSSTVRRRQALGERAPLHLHSALDRARE